MCVCVHRKGQEKERDIGSEVVKIGWLGAVQKSIMVYTSQGLGEVLHHVVRNEYNRIPKAHTVTTKVLPRRCLRDG